jgi:hypothetical protein
MLAWEKAASRRGELGGGKAMWKPKAISIVKYKYFS